MQICYFSNHLKQDLREGSWGGELTEEIWGEGRSEGGERGEERERKKEGGLME